MKTPVIRPVLPARRLVRLIASLAFASLAFISLSASMLHGQTLERGNGPEPDSLDPQRAQGLSAQNILRDIFEGLTREDAHGAIIPGLATSWEVSSDGLVWTFHLRENARFSDGSAIVAADVVNSFARALNPSTAASYAPQLLVLRGASARLSGVHDAPLGARALDAHRVELTLTQVTPNLAARLSLPVAAVVPIKIIDKFGDKWTRAGNIVSSGAYALQDWRPLSSVRLIKNPYYYEAAGVAINQVRYHVTEDTSEEARRFEAGELALTETIPPGRLVQLRARFGNKLRVAPSLGSFFLGFNLTQAPLKGNLALRQSLSLAIDRPRIVSIITGTGEIPATGLLPSVMTQRCTGLQRIDESVAVLTEQRLRNEAQARALYEKAGYSIKKPLTIELRYNTSLLNRRLMLAVSVMWEQVLGVRTVLRQEEWKVLVQNRKAKRITQVFRGGWNADLADPLDFLDTFDSMSALNTTGFESAQFTALLHQLRTTSDPEQACALALRTEAALMAEQPILPLFFYTSKHLVAPALAGFVENPLDHHPSRLLYWRTP
jgi:oligopeptide transport system substrate-binding protein